MTAELEIKIVAPPRPAMLLCWRATDFARVLRLSAHSVLRLCNNGFIKHIRIAGTPLLLESPQDFLARIVVEHPEGNILPPELPPGERRRPGRPNGAKDRVPRKRRAPAQLKVVAE